MRPYWVSTADCTLAGDCPPGMLPSYHHISAGEIAKVTEWPSIEMGLEAGEDKWVHVPAIAGETRAAAAATVARYLIFMTGFQSKGS